jgi:hypothetical protein
LSAVKPNGPAGVRFQAGWRENVMTHRTVIALFILSLWAAPMAARSSAPPALYDSSAEKAISGTISAVVTLQDTDGTVGVHLDLQTADGLVRVHLAPAMFVGQKNFSFEVDDEVVIIGTRTLHDGNSAIWAKAIQKGRSLLGLRSADGTPKWMPATDGADGCGVHHAPLPIGTER